MTDLAKLFNARHIVTDLAAANKEEAIAALVEHLFRKTAGAPPKMDPRRVLAEVMEREATHSTGVGEGLAFPHARIVGWGGLSAVLGVFREDIDFDSVDHVPVRIVCLIISSDQEPYAVLQAMSALVRVLNDPQRRERFWRPGVTPALIAEEFRGAGLRAGAQLLAGDIARPVRCAVTPETSIEEATRLMHINQFDILPVVNDQGVLQGEISCLEIFEFGIPDFFHQLNTISFVRHIDPFEKYFRIKKDLRVRDLAIQHGDALSEDATLMEVMFDLSVRKRSKLFVTRDGGVLVGVIDRFTIIDKILFF